MSKLYFRYGAMNSGKSTALLQAAHNYHQQGFSVIVIKPTTDTKSPKVVSRTGLSRPVDLPAPPGLNLCAALIEARKNFPQLGCVLVDEAQFLTVAQVDELLDFATFQRVPVLTYGLRTDFRTRAFPGSQRLLEISQVVEELKTVCSCGVKATFNARKTAQGFDVVGDQVGIDGQGHSYVSLCARCYLSNVTP